MKIKEIMKKIKCEINERKLIDRLSMFTIVWTLALLVLYGILTLYPFKIVEFYQTDPLGNGIYLVVDKVIEEGELLRYRVHFKKLSNETGELNCFFEDGILFRVPSSLSTQPVGERDFIQAVSIPETLPSGKYRYVCVVTYEKYFDRLITYQFATDEFEVIKNEQN
jgi:hypothetical protein